MVSRYRNGADGYDFFYGPFEQHPCFDFHSELLPPTIMASKPFGGTELNCYPWCPKDCTRQNHRKCNMNLTFDFMRYEVDDLRSSQKNDNRPLQVLVRFTSLNHPVKKLYRKDCPPLGLSMDVNETSLLIPESREEALSAGPQYPRYVGYPLNITRIILDTVHGQSRDQQDIDITWVHEPEVTYLVTVRLERPKDAEFLLRYNLELGENLRPSFHTIQRVKELFSRYPEAERKAYRLRMPLACPVNGRRLVKPCRADTCLHPNCFETLAFLRTNMRKPNWQCPVCLKPAQLDSLKVDSFMTDLLKSAQLPADCTEVDVDHDGAWVPVTPDSEGRLLPQPTLDLASALELLKCGPLKWIVFDDKLQEIRRLLAEEEARKNAVPVINLEECDSDGEYATSYVSMPAPPVVVIDEEVQRPAPTPNPVAQAEVQAPQGVPPQQQEQTMQSRSSSLANPSRIAATVQQLVAGIGALDRACRQQNVVFPPTLSSRRVVPSSTAQRVGRILSSYLTNPGVTIIRDTTTAQTSQPARGAQGSAVPTASLARQQGRVTPEARSSSVPQNSTPQANLAQHTATSTGNRVLGPQGTQTIPTLTPAASHSAVPATAQLPTDLPARGSTVQVQLVQSAVPPQNATPGVLYFMVPSDSVNDPFTFMRAQEQAIPVAAAQATTTTQQATAPTTQAAAAVTTETQPPVTRQQRVRRLNLENSFNKRSRR